MQRDLQLLIWVVRDSVAESLSLNMDCSKQVVVGSNVKTKVDLTLEVNTVNSTYTNEKI